MAEHQSEHQSESESPRIKGKAKDIIKRDLRYAATVDQAKFCWSLYNNFMRCSNANHSDDAKECVVEKARVDTVCPKIWRTQWADAREKKVWYGLPGKDSDENPRYAPVDHHHGGDGGHGGHDAGHGTAAGH